MHGGFARAKCFGTGADRASRFGNVFPATPHALLDRPHKKSPSFDKIFYSMSNQGGLYVFSRDPFPCGASMLAYFYYNIFFRKPMIFGMRRLLPYPCLRYDVRKPLPRQRPRNSSIPVISLKMHRLPSECPSYLPSETASRSE